MSEHRSEFRQLLDMARTETTRLEELYASREVLKSCGCRSCLYSRNDPMRGRFMLVCAVCGNKRCPHAEYHRFGCTASNESGQIGVEHAFTGSRGITYTWRPDWVDSIHDEVWAE